MGHGAHVVEQGECILSVAYENGFFWETLWNHPENSVLKRCRKDPNLLLPGDRVHVPERRERLESCVSERRHRFVKKGVPGKIRIVLLDSAGRPRALLDYLLVVDGTVRSGKTTAAGLVEMAIPPHARKAELIVREGGGEERHDLDLGYLDPIETLTGVMARLHNLGYECAADESTSEAAQAAVRAFREDHALHPGEAIDDALRDRLRLEYERN